MVESIQSSHQVNSFPLQAALGILPIDFAILPSACCRATVLRGPSQLIFVIQGTLPATLLFPLVKTVKPTLSHRHSGGQCPEIPAPAVSPC